MDFAIPSVVCGLQVYFLVHRKRILGISFFVNVGFLRYLDSGG